MKKSILIYLSTTHNSIHRKQINQDPHNHNRKCNLPTEHFWTVDIIRNDESALCCSACVGNKYTAPELANGTADLYLKHFKFLFTNLILMVYDNDVFNISQSYQTL